MTDEAWHVALDHAELCRRIAHSPSICCALGEEPPASWLARGARAAAVAANLHETLPQRIAGVMNAEGK